MTEMEGEIYNSTDNLQDLIGKENPWLSRMFVCLSLFVLVAFFVCSLIITYKGQTLLEILSAPMLRYFTILCS